MANHENGYYSFSLAVSLIIVNRNRLLNYAPYRVYEFVIYFESANKTFDPDCEINYQYENTQFDIDKRLISD